MARDRPARGRKVRVDFRPNRSGRRRERDLTRRYRDEAQADRVVDHASVESVRAKGELSRKRTVVVPADQTPAADERHQRHGLVTAVHGLICRLDDDDGVTWDCTVSRVLRTRLIAQRSPVTCGDRVWFTPAASAGAAQRVGVIERVDERRTRLSRADRRGREHAIVANAEQLLIVASVFEPIIKPHLIDRYIVAALKGGLTPVIAVNKIDLYGGADGRAPIERDEASGDGPSGGAPEGWTLEELIGEFRGLGYTCLCTSAATGEGLEALRDVLRGRVTVIAGQSGVGKSSLINAIQPGLKLRVAEVSQTNEKGQHTTSFAQLLRLDFGGYVVDTPGIRAFGLWDVQPGELEACFVEFLPLIQSCRFNDCLHVDQPGCAVIGALEQGRISERRYWSYVKMLREAQQAADG